MGTSTSYSGPSDTAALLPSWAVEPTASGSSAAESGAPLKHEPPDKKKKKVEPTAATKETATQPAHARWRSAKSGMGRIASKGSSPKRIGSASRGYVKAKGGAKRAARSATAGKSSAIALGGFLADVAKQGVERTLENLGVTDILGKDAETVFLMIIEALVPAGAQPEEAVAREAMIDALWKLYDRLGIDEGGIAKLGAVNREVTGEVIETCVTEYIYSRWLQETGMGIERQAGSEQEAIRVERDVKNYIIETVHLDFQGKDLLAINWKGREGRALMEKKFQEAYRILEGS